MPQFARPSADTTLGTFTDQGGGSTNIYTTIDEVVASDADYIRSAAVPVASVYVTLLSSVEDPQSSSGHVLRYRYAKDAAGGGQINLTAVQLRQGYVSEASQGTLIASTSQTNISETFTTGTLTLSAAETDSITNYAALFVRIVVDQV